MPDASEGFKPSLGGSERQVVGFNAFKDLASSLDFVLKFITKLGDSLLSRAIFRPTIVKAWSLVGDVCKAMVMMEVVNPAVLYADLKFLR